MSAVRPNHPKKMQYIELLTCLEQAHTATGLDLGMLKIKAQKV